MHTAGTSLVLASASAARARLLRDAGLVFVTDPADLDEHAWRDMHPGQDGDAAALAGGLAEAKARRVARRHPGHLVVGADQVLTCEGELLEKPGVPARARAQLERLSGRDHRLTVGAALVRDNALLWRHEEHASLTMRPLTPPFLDWYIARAGTSVLACVGAYELEGLGAHLFERIEGDYFTILGLPLLPLLAALRAAGCVPA